mgnify:CR=1 FL=1
MSTTIKRGRSWSDEELGRLADLRHLTAREAGVVLGRTRKQVLHMRQRIEKGWTRQLEAITEDDLAFVAAYPHFTAEQIGRHLGRSTAAINSMRSTLRSRGVDLSTAAWATEKNPWMRGARPLVAQSCRKCGLLLDESWFTSRGQNRPGHRRTICRKCAARDLSANNKVKRHTQRAAARLQAASLAWAERNGQEWTDAELDALTDLSRTNFEKSIALKRSYFAVCTAMSNAGLRERVPELRDPTDAQWVIRLRADIERAVAPIVRRVA